MPLKLSSVVLRDIGLIADKRVVVTGYILPVESVDRTNIDFAPAGVM